MSALEEALHRLKREGCGWLAEHYLSAKHDLSAPARATYEQSLRQAPRGRGYPSRKNTIKSLTPHHNWTAKEHRQIATLELSADLLYQRWDEYCRAYNRAQAQKRRTNMKGAPSAATIKRLMDAQDGLCRYCRRPLGEDYHVDHVRAVIEGGTSHERNLALACPPCNMSKGRKSLAEWRRFQARREAIR
jgi:hypothetical protein